MTRCRSSHIALLLLIAAIVGAGCHSEKPSSAAVAEPTPFVPRLVQQQSGPEMMEFKPSDVPGVVLTEVKNVELPGVLETSGQVSFDDRRISSIVSRVQGRIEDTRVSLWDSVSRGEKIVALYSPDFMTAEAELLQARTTDKLSTAAGVGGTSNLAGAMASAAYKKLELL
ncbi:MAG: hypothetical protein JWM69_932, partial [Candidatus Binatus sp.]|nr:hypothetical protein [Candidatus Binatus sp.]